MDEIKASILLVDDKPEQLFALQTVLADLNQNVVTARSGREALRHLLANEFAVILLDVNMPGMDGFETAALIRQRQSSEHTPIIFVTAYDNTLTHVSQGYSLGAVDYIHRPIVPQVLKAKVSALVDLYRKNELIRRLREQEHERRLDESRDQLEAEAKRNIFFVLSIDLLGIAGFDLVFKQLNPAWEKTLGHRDPELTSRPMLDFIHPEDRTAMSAQLEKLVAGETIAHFENRFQRRDGTWRWLAWTAAPFKAEQLIYIYARDITDRKNIEQERALNLVREQQRAARFRRLAEAGIAISAALTTNRILEVVAEEALKTLEAHLAMVRMFPEAGNDLPLAISAVSEKYEAWRDGRLEEAELYAGLRRLDGPVRLTAAQTAETTGHAATGNGDGLPPLRGWLSAPLTGRDGHAIGVIELSDRADDGDFSEQDEAILIQLARMASLSIENALFFEAREANRLKDEFLATLSHELRTPLTAVLNALWLLKSGVVQDSERFEQTVEMIDRNARMQVRLIEDMLDISRITTGKLQLEKREIDLPRLVREAVDGLRPAAESRNLAIHVECDEPAVPGVFADPDRLNQVIVNLVSNSIKFTEPGGRIDVRLEAEHPFARIVVCDNGQGIDPAFLPWIFDRFRQGDSARTRRHGGLGLGLSIVKHMVELHGGTVDAHSDGKGRGATFTVRLPLRNHSGDGEPSWNDAEPWTAGMLLGARVLMVDDEPDSSRMLRAVLEQSGAVVTSAASAAEALSILEATARDNGEAPFDVLLSDIAMPQQDGYELLTRVRSNPVSASIPAIALTAYARDVDRSHALRSGFQMHLAKPVDPARLVQMVATLAGRAPGRETSLPESPGMTDAVPMAPRPAGRAEQSPEERPPGL